MKTALQGSFPKIPAGKGPSVRTAIQRFDRGTIGPEELYRVCREVIQNVLELAEKSDIDRTTDGQIRWNDLFDPVVRDIDNVYSEGLLRLFDNNFYYRHPVIRGRLQYQGGVLAHWTREAMALSRVPLKVALPGPSTFLSLSEDQSYGDDDRLLADLVSVLALEANSLADTGIVEVQWDEPALARGQGDPKRAQALLEQLLRSVQLPQSVALYWGRHGGQWLERLKDLPLTAVYVDVVSEPEVLSRLSEESYPYAVGVGIVDGRNVRPEDPQMVARQLEPILARQGSDRVIVHPSCGLELLPPDRAADKVRLLGSIKALINGSGNSIK